MSAPEPNVTIILAKNLEDGEECEIYDHPYKLKNTYKDKESGIESEVEQFIIPVGKFKHIRTNNTSYISLWEAFGSDMKGHKFTVVRVPRTDGKFNTYLKPVTAKGKKGVA